MVRTIISLSENSKKWLDHYSHQSHQSVAETVRQAIEFYKNQKQKALRGEILEQTSGLWKGKKINSLQYVKKLREEW